MPDDMPENARKDVTGYNMCQILSPDRMSEDMPDTMPEEMPQNMPEGCKVAFADRRENIRRHAG